MGVTSNEVLLGGTGILLVMIPVLFYALALTKKSVGRQGGAMNKMDRALDMQQESLELIRESVALQRETNALLREIRTRLDPKDLR